MSGVWYGYTPAQPQVPSNEELIKIKESVHQASIRLSKWRKKERVALERETKRQSELVLEERVRWRETLKGQRREMVERYVDERRLLTTRTAQHLTNGYAYKPHINDVDNIHSDYNYDLQKRLEYEKFLDRNIFGHANDNEVEDYGYYLDTRRENKPVTGILSKFIQDPKQLIKKVKSEDDSSPLDSPIVLNDEIDNHGTFKLIDALFLLGPHDDDVNRVCLLNPLSTVTERVEPHILFECGSVPGVETEVLPFFSFPSGVEVTTSSATSKRPTKSFVFVLASHTYSQYAICMVVPRTFKDPANPSSNRLITTEYSICVVTRLPFISYLTHILHRSDLMGWIFPSLKEPIQARDSPQDIIPPVLYSLNDLANRLRRMKVLFEIPEDPIVEADDCLLKYDSVEFTLPWRSIDGVNQMKNRDTFILPRDKHAELFYTQIQSRVEIMQVQRPLMDRENTFYTLMWSLPILLKHLPLEEIMLVLGCALTEMRVIIHAPDLHVVSGCLLALANLLRPLKWAGVIIVTLPSSSLYMNYLESPVPMIVGMQQLPSDFQLKDGTVIVDPLHNAAHKAVQLHSKDVVESHTLTLPHTSVLIKSLKDQAENILRSTKKYNRMADAKDEDARNFNYKPPIELDAITDDGQLFLSSVSAFVSILETHLTTVVNTAVFLTREQSRQQKIKANVGKTQSIDSFRNKASIDLMDDHSDIGDAHSDAGDNKSQISIASDESESMPPIEKDAPRLNTRGQNDSHLLFVRRLMATQMFEDYCHVASETHKKAVIKAKNAKLDSSKSKLAETNQDAISQRNPVRRYSTDANGMSLKNVFNNNDSLVSLFITILSGSAPITEEQLQYMNDSINENENLDVQHRDVFCNGRCGGMANSPLCTSLCVTLWEQHVYIESQKQKMQELLIKHRNSQFVIARKKLLKAVPRIRPTQHPRETDSQYEKRCGTVFKNINNETMDTSAFEGDEDYESSPKVSTALKQLSKYFVNRELSRIGRNRKREELELRNRELRELSAIKIQAIARGYFVRFDTLKLFNRLVEAKLAVLGSKIKARNILRKAMARRQLLLLTTILDDFKQERAVSPIVAPIGIKSPTSSNKKINNIPYEIAELKPSVANNDKSNRSLPNQASFNKEKSKTLHLGERATGALSKFFRSVFPEAQSSNSSNSRRVDKKSKAVLVESALVDTKKSAAISFKADLSTIPKKADVKLTVAPHSSVDTKNEASPGSDDSQTKQVWRELNNFKSSSIDKTFDDDANSDVSTVINAPIQLRDIMKVSNQTTATNDFTASMQILPEFDQNSQSNLASLSKPKTQVQLELDTEEDIDENNEDIYSSPPILSLGAPARVSLTLQQHLIVIEMWSLLRKGVTVLKHGHSGKPRLRFLYCDPSMKTLYWREHNLGPNPDTPVWKTRRSSFLKDDNDRRLCFKDILEVRADYSTEVMTRSVSKNYTNVNDDTAFISIILYDKTFDIEVQVDQWDSLFHAFQILTNYYRVLLPNFSMKS